ncbi:MAG: hypothetical protein WCA13_07705 [Terriglobales bacterium]
MPHLHQRRGFQAKSEVHSSQSLVQALWTRDGLFRAIPDEAVLGYAARKLQRVVNKVERRGVESPTTCKVASGVWVE